jgi:chromosome partitioning protein
MFDRRTRHSHEILEQLKKYFNRYVCDPIHHNVRLSEAPAYGQTIFEYAVWAQGAQDYQNLIERVTYHGNGEEKNT